MFFNSISVAWQWFPPLYFCSTWIGYTQYPSPSYPTPPPPPNPFSRPNFSVVRKLMFFFPFCDPLPVGWKSAVGAETLTVCFLMGAFPASVDSWERRSRVKTMFSFCNACHFPKNSGGAPPPHYVLTDLDDREELEIGDAPNSHPLWGVNKKLQEEANLQFPCFCFLNRQQVGPLQRSFSSLSYWIAIQVPNSLAPPHCTPSLFIFFFFRHFCLCFNTNIIFPCQTIYVMECHFFGGNFPPPKMSPLCKLFFPCASLYFTCWCWFFFQDVTFFNF